MVSPEDKENRIWLNENYHDEEGRVVVRMVNAENHTDEIFVGHGVATIRAPDGRVGQLKMQFVIEAETLFDAFEKFDAVHEERRKKAIEEMNQPKIAVAGAAPRMPGRNEPCPCGSGLKFKQCCLPGTGHNRLKAMGR